MAQLVNPQDWGSLFANAINEPLDKGTLVLNAHYEPNDGSPSSNMYAVTGPDVNIYISAANTENGNRWLRRLPQMAGPLAGNYAGAVPGLAQSPHFLPGQGQAPAIASPYYRPPNARPTPLMIAGPPGAAAPYPGLPSEYHAKPPKLLRESSRIHAEFASPEVKKGGDRNYTVSMPVSRSHRFTYEFECHCDSEHDYGLKQLKVVAKRATPSLNSRERTEVYAAFKREFYQEDGWD